MGFIPISVSEYIRKHLENNPSANETDLRKSLNVALSAYRNGVKCQCGNDIWVIGSAAVGNSCFSCITGESFPSDDYEIDSAINKAENKKGKRHIEDIDPSKIQGIFDDDGYEINTELINKPGLCILCLNNDDPSQKLLCDLTRYDQKESNEFICFAFKRI